MNTEKLLHCNNESNIATCIFINFFLHNFKKHMYGMHRLRNLTAKMKFPEIGLEMLSENDIFLTSLNVRMLMATHHSLRPPVSHRLSALYLT